MDKKIKLYAGHVLMIFCFFIYMGTVGVAGYGNPVLTTRIVLINGWDKSIIGNSTSMFQLGQAIGLMAFAPFFIKIGAKKIMIGGISISILAYLVQIIVQPTGFVYSLMFVGCGICAGSGLLCLPALMNNWFTRRKSFPISVVRTAGSVGGTLMPLVANKMITVGPQAAWSAFLFVNIVALVLSILFIKQDPSDIGEIPDSRDWVEKHPLPEVRTIKAEAQAQDQAQTQAQVEPSGLKKGIYAAYTSFQFIALSCITCFQRFMLFSFTTFAMVFVIEKGISQDRAAYMIAIYGLTGSLGRILTAGSDLIPFTKKTQLAATLLILCGGCVMLAAGKAELIFLLAAATIGAFNGFYSSLFPIVVADFFDKRAFAVMYSTLNVIGSIAGIVVPMVVSAIYHSVNTYVVPFNVAAVLLIIGCAMTLVIKPPVLKHD
jgi:MFS family permease